MAVSATREQAKNELARGQCLLSFGTVEKTINLRFAMFIGTFVVACILLVAIWHEATSTDTPEDVTLSLADLQSNEQAKALIAKANRFLDQMKRVCAEQGLAFVGSGEFLPTSGKIQQGEGDAVVGPTMQLSSPDYTFAFWMKNNQFVMFFNVDLQYRLYGKDGPRLDQPDTAKLTELEAKQRAKSVLALIDVPEGIKLGVAKARFEPQTDPPAYRFGWWHVAWARIDEEGHPFACDYGVSMDMPEGYGPVLIGVGLRIPYTKEEGDVLSQDSALAAARAEIDKSRAGFVTTPIPNDVGIVDDKVVDSNLTIVEAVIKGPWWMWWAKPERTTRLAWMFWFEPEFATPVADPKGSRRFVISVEAHSGDILNVTGMR